MNHARQFDGLGADVGDVLASILGFAGHHGNHRLATGARRQVRLDVGPLAGRQATVGVGGHGVGVRARAAWDAGVLGKRRSQQPVHPGVPLAFRVHRTPPSEERTQRRFLQAQGSGLKAQGSGLKAQG